MAVFENRTRTCACTLAGTGRRACNHRLGDRLRHEGEQDLGRGARKRRPAGTAVDASTADGGKIIPLSWKMPFTAQWRVDFTRKDGLTDSWDMLLPDKDSSGFLKPSWLAKDGEMSTATRTATGEVDGDAYKPGGPASARLSPDRRRWTTVLGWVQYPCWCDHEHNGFLQPLKHRRVSFDGPCPSIHSPAWAETPVARYTPVDIMRNTLGVGPCQHLLDVEGQKQEHVGRGLATCGTSFPRPTAAVGRRRSEGTSRTTLGTASTLSLTSATASSRTLLSARSSRSILRSSARLTRS